MCILFGQFLGKQLDRDARYKLHTYIVKFLLQIVFFSSDDGLLDRNIVEL
jgi:hypothetical protein